MGRKITETQQPNLSSGNHTITINPQTLGIASGNYVYQLQVQNSNGTFRQCKMMTAQ